MISLNVIDLYRNCAVALRAIDGPIWTRPGAAASASAVPWWGHIIHNCDVAYGTRTFVVASFSVEWSQGNQRDGDGRRIGGVRLVCIEAGRDPYPLCEITQDRDPEHDPETSGVWISDKLQDLIDRGSNAMLSTEMRGGANVYGIHLYYAIYTPPVWARKDKVDQELAAIKAQIARVS